MVASPHHHQHHGEHHHHDGLSEDFPRAKIVANRVTHWGFGGRRATNLVFLASDKGKNEGKSQSMVVKLSAKYAECIPSQWATPPLAGGSPAAGRAARAQEAKNTLNEVFHEKLAYGNFKWCQLFRRVCVGKSLGAAVAFGQ